MSIKDREYWEDAAGDWEGDNPPREPKKPWTATRILAWASLCLLLAALAALAILGHGKS